MDITSYIRTIPDFPKPGIMFKDITPLLGDPKAFALSIDLLAEKLSNIEYSAIVGIESRGFIFGAALAYKCGKKLVPVRKKNKLPAETFQVEYALEYGTDILEIHKDSLNPHEKVIIIDDLFATGGTVNAVEKLIGYCGAHISGVAFIIELMFLNGRKNISSNNVISLIQYN
ncbi:MAG: adenine phosphoribosyltransferase [Candidatus Margulisbacteria bacterium GWF2_35_9]|nr:MAG: adenine phosphoribosyltransferase [Candidatus Margulisbacteria bacterium GWF2_35_9]